MEQHIFIAFLLTLFAGLSTGIGGLIVFFTQQTNKKLLSFSLGLSAGVMILVSFAEFLIQSREILTEEMGNTKGLLTMWLCFFGGILFIGIIDRLIPSFENPHEIQHLEDMEKPIKKGSKLMRMGILTSFAIAIHNFPEGIATLIAGVENPTLGIAIATAVAIHNIPEGIAVAIGAIVAYLVLMPFITPVLMGQIFAIVAGIMVFISLDELLPATHAFGEHHLSIYGLIFGMAIMALSLIMMA